MSDEVIDGKRIFLRPLVKKDAAKIKKICHDRSINRFTHVPYPYRIKDALEFIEKSRIKRKKKEEYVYGIINKETNELMGTISLVRIIKRDNKAKIGYLLGKKYRNKGYMTETCKLFVDYIFKKFKLYKIYINCAKDNKASKNVITKVGAKEEALLRKDILLGGKYHDHYIHSIWRDDWKKWR
jgi:ribosomal-protein-alanine N-acetyltransferase